MELVKRGDRVSLNMERRIAYTQGKYGINLTMGGNKTEIIPNSISDDSLKRINMAIRIQMPPLAREPKYILIRPEQAMITVGPKNILYKNGNCENNTSISVIEDPNPNFQGYSNA